MGTPVFDTVDVSAFQALTAPMLIDNNPLQRQIWRTDAKTGETTYIDLRVGVGGARRGHIDAQNRLCRLETSGLQSAMIAIRLARPAYTAAAVPIGTVSRFDWT